VRTTAFVCGLIGGIFGILAAIVELAGGGVGSALADDDEGLVLLGFLSLLLAITGIVGASLSRSHPGWSGALQIVAMIGGLLTAGLFWIISAILFLVGGIFAFAGHGRRDKPVVSA
jgi:hypothetical protein